MTSLQGLESVIARPMAQVDQRHFAGRVGGNQEFILDPKCDDDLSTLKRLPDANPLMSVKEVFSLRGFLELELWKAALTEGLGTLLLVWITVWMAAHPPFASPPPPSPTAGVFSTDIFLAPLVGGVTNVILVSLFIYTLGPVSGAHLNPTITISTFTARLTTFPRMVLYVSFQTVGAALAGLLLRASYGTRNFAVGGCTVDNNLVPIIDALVIEFMADLTLLFIAFGVGLDPRQRDTFGPALGPVLVGLLVGVVSFGTAWSRPGYYGSSLNPARCLGAFVGSSFPTYHWVQWVGPVIAAIVHGGLYWLLPPWTYKKPDADDLGLI
jgi:glycerol uptake facilitator-like aquaporin